MVVVDDVAAAAAACCLDRLRELLRDLCLVLDDDEEAYDGAEHALVLELLACAIQGGERLVFAK